MVRIVQEGDPVLRGTAHAVSKADIGGKKLAGILSDMKRALAGQEDGVALAAPQIGVPLRIFVVSGKIFKKEDAPDTPPDRVFINPKIEKTSRKKNLLEEGCLSVRWKYGEVPRFTKATISALDETGRPFSLGASGLLAQIFQHEVDHLNGILFIDTAQNVRDMPPERTPRP